MKKTLVIIAAAFCALAVSAKDKGGILPDGYQKFTKAKRVCVGREIVEIGGVKKVITRWNRDGRPDWILQAVETNDLRKLRGVEQFNPLQKDAETLRDFKKLAEKASEKNSKIFEIECKILEKARDKSASQELKNLYQLTLDIWRSKVNARK